MRNITNMKEFLEDLYIQCGQIAGSMAYKREAIEEIVNLINANVEKEQPDEDSKLKKYQYLYKELRVRAQWGMDFTGGPFRFSPPWGGMQGQIAEAYEKLGYKREDLPIWEIQPIKTMVTFKQNTPSICSDCINLEFEPESNFLGEYDNEHERFYDLLDHFINDTYMIVAGSQMYDEILNEIIARDGETYSSIIIKIMFKSGLDYFSGAKNCYKDSAVNQHKKAGYDKQFAEMKIDHHFMYFFMQTNPIHFDALTLYKVNRDKLCDECKKHVSPLHLHVLNNK